MSSIAHIASQVPLPGPPFPRATFQSALKLREGNDAMKPEDVDSGKPRKTFVSVILSILFISIISLMVIVGRGLAYALGAPPLGTAALFGGALGVPIGFWLNGKIWRLLCTKFTKLVTFRPLFVFAHQGGWQPNSWREAAISQFFIVRTFGNKTKFLGVLFLSLFSINFVYCLYLFVFTRLIFPEIPGKIVALCQAESSVVLANIVKGLIPAAALFSQQVHQLDIRGVECFDAASALAWLLAVLVFASGAIFLFARSRECGRSREVTKTEKYFASGALILLFIMIWGLGIGAKSTTTFEKLPELVFLTLLTVVVALYLVATVLSLAKTNRRF